MPIYFIGFLLYKCHGKFWEMVFGPRTHHRGLVVVHIAKVVTILGHYLDSARVKLIARLRNQRHVYSTQIAADALPMVDACNPQNAQIIINRQPPAIAAALWQFAIVSTVIYRFYSFGIFHKGSLPQQLQCGRKLRLRLFFNR